MLFTTSTPETASVSSAIEFVQAPPPAPARATSAAPAQPAQSNASRKLPPRDEAALAGVLSHPGIWRRGTATTRATADVQPSGIVELDARLPGGGWPRGALSEILIEHDGIGECSLVLPALAALTQAKKRVVFVAPPYIPYAPALAAAGVDLSQVVHIEAGATDSHWTAEQCLRAGCCGAVLSWLPTPDYRQLRRLQLAAETGAAIGFVFRPLAAAKETSPAALRLRVAVREGGPRIDILKCRGLQRDAGFSIKEAQRLSA